MEEKKVIKSPQQRIISTSEIKQCWNFKTASTSRWRLRFLLSGKVAVTKSKSNSPVEPLYFYFNVSFASLYINFFFFDKWLFLHRHEFLFGINGHCETFIIKFMKMLYKCWSLPGRFNMSLIETHNMLANKSISISNYSIGTLISNSGSYHTEVNTLLAG